MVTRWFRSKNLGLFNYSCRTVLFPGHWLDDPEGVTVFSVSLNSQTGSRAHSASISAGTGVLFWAVKHLGPEAENSLPFSVEVKNECSYTSIPHMCLHDIWRDNSPFTRSEWWNFCILNDLCNVYLQNWSEMQFPLLNLSIFLILAVVDVGAAVYTRYVLQIDNKVM